MKSERGPWASLRRGLQTTDVDEGSLRHEGRLWRLGSTLTGVLALCLLSIPQKHYLGASIADPLGYVVPCLFGGGVGLLSGILVTRLRRAFVEHLTCLEEANQRLEAENAARLAAERSLEHEKARYQTLFSLAPVSLIVADDGGHVRSHNRAAERLYGAQLEPQLGAWVSEVGGIEERDVEVRGASGEPRVVWRTRVPLDDLEVMICDRDVTVRKRLEAQLITAQKMEAVGEMAGGIAHDFNNLMTGIVGHAELGMLDPDEEGFERIRELAEHASALAHRLLDLRKVGHQQAVELDLNAALRDTLKLLRPALSARVLVTLEPAATRPRVRLDPVQLEQVIINLIINARDAMPEGGRLKLETQHEGNRALLIVEDEGVGMSAAALKRATEAFYTTKPLGNGLGLTAVKRIVEEAGGALEIESVEGEGTRAVISLPTKPPKAPPMGLGAVLSPTPLPTRAEASRVSLWLIDDNPVVLESLSLTLQRAGFNPSCFSDPRLAQEACEAAAPGEAPDLLISDVVMPHLNGPALAKALRARWPALPIIFLSAYHAEFEPIERSQRLAKPFKSADLFALIADTLKETRDLRRS